MILYKYSKLLIGIVILIALVVFSQINASAKVSNQVKYTYYSNKKVKSKFVKKIDGKKVLRSDHTNYYVSGKANNATSIIYGKGNKALVNYYFKYNGSKKVKRKVTFYYNTHSKNKTPLKSAYQVNYYNSKGKYVKSTYVTKVAKRNAVVSFAKKQNGKRYRSGGSGPSSFDCSGLTSYVYKKTLKKNIGRTSYAQNKKGKTLKISTKKLAPGDVLFWGSKSSPYHVGIYLGNGKYIHASTPSTGVQIKKLNSFKPSYAKRMI